MTTKEEVAEMLAQYQYDKDEDSGPIYRLTTNKEDAVVVTPEEFELLRAGQLSAGQLSLPDGRSLGQAFDRHAVSTRVAV